MWHAAVDIGASGGRLILGRLRDGRIEMREAHRFPNGMAARDGHLWWDDAALLREIAAGLRACGAMGERPATLAIDTWGVDFRLLDADGKPLGGMAAYRDARTAGMPEALDRALPFSRLYEITGIARQPFNTVYQLMALFRETPSLREDARTLLFAPCWLSAALTGERANEYTIASTSALLDVRTRAFSPEVLRAAGIPERLFGAPLVPPQTRLGRLLPEIAREVGFDVEVILPASHDTASAFLAVPAQGDNAAFLSSGTWSLLGMPSAEPFRGADSREAGFTNEGGGDGGIRFLRNIMGMWMLQRLRAETPDAPDYARMAALAEASDYAGSVDAEDARFLAPDSMRDAVLQSLRERGFAPPSDEGGLYRAVLSGLAECYARGILGMEKITGRRFTALHVVGGGSRNAALNRMTARAAGLPVIAGPVEATAIGNLLCQMRACGELASRAEELAAVRASFPVEETLP